MINKGLIEILKKQNDDLSDRISRRKIKPKFHGKLNKSNTEGDTKCKALIQKYQKVTDKRLQADRYVS